MIDLTGKRVIISRTDSIGDVMLTLPICAWLKEQFADIEIIFLGKGYTRPIVEGYDCVHSFLDWEQIQKLPSAEQLSTLSNLKSDAIIHVFPERKIAALAKKAKIKVRVGTSHRTFHLLTCTHRVNFTRKKSNLHEAQLNHELLRPFGLTALPSLEDVVKKVSHFKPIKTELPSDLANLNSFIILHPKSQGSAKEWPISKYMELAIRLVEAGKKVVFTGTESEGLLFRNQIVENKNIIDSTGKLTLNQLISLIEKAEGLVACSTGPLHIAGYLGIKTVGLYSPKRPIHPGRWKSLGDKVRILVNDESCPNCKKGVDCNCITEISVERVYEELT
jgi:ADP-heptose:LPS heptosyltransferase